VAHRCSYNPKHKS